MLEGAKYIKEVPFSSLFNWSVQYLSETKISFNSSYPMVSIGSFLTRNKTSINIENGVTYKRVTIKVRNGGVVQRDSEIGDNIGTKRQYKVSEGQFILSKIDARNGAMGLIPRELEGAIVTQDFLPYDLDTSKINPQYLVLVSTTKEFVAFCQTCSSGTTNRQRVDEAKFLDIKIPLPTIEEQNKLVADYNKKMALAAKQESQALTKEQKIIPFLLTTLGIEIQNKAKKERLQFVKYSKILRWDYWNKSEDATSIYYRQVKLMDLITLQSGKFLPKSAQKEGVYAIYGGNGITGFHNKYCYTGKRLVIGRVGEYCGNVHLVDGEYWITDNALRLDLISNDLTYEYLELALRAIDLGRYRVVSAQPSISQSVILNLSIPLPPIEIQNEIATHISGLKQEIKKLRTTAESNRKAALTNFEQKIF